jgi:triosephosphate isomerase
MRTKLVAGNWKMHGSLATNLGLLTAVRDGAKGSAEVAVCVPYPYLAQAQACSAAARSRGARRTFPSTPRAPGPER